MEPRINLGSGLHGHRRGSDIRCALIICLRLFLFVVADGRFDGVLSQHRTVKLRRRKVTGNGRVRDPHDEVDAAALGPVR